MKNHVDDKLLLDQCSSLFSGRDGHPMCPALEDFSRTIDKTQENINGKIKLYKWSALILSTLIPVFSAIISFGLSAKDDEAWKVYITILSFVLTLMTLLNSIFNPGERFKQVCRLGVGLGNLKRDVMERMEALSGVEQDSLHVNVHDLVNRYTKSLNHYQEQLIDLFLPELQVKTADALKEGSPKTEASGSRPPAAV